MVRSVSCAGGCVGQNDHTGLKQQPPNAPNSKKTALFQQISVNGHDGIPFNGFMHPSADCVGFVKCIILGPTGAAGAYSYFSRRGGREVRGRRGEP